MFEVAFLKKIEEMPPETKSMELIMAVKRNDLLGVKTLLEDLENEGTQGMKYHVVNSEMGAFGMRALHLASFQDNLEIVKLLLENGGQANASDRLGKK